MTAEKKEKTAKKRLDILLTERGFAPSREKAKTVIMSGIVYVNGQKEDKAGAAFADAPETVIEVRGNVLPYVSRGGLKLAKAIREYAICLDGMTCMDIGASTGGFTDCMLQNGAKKVFAVDVGHGQLDWKLRNDPRVVCMEKTNIRYLEPEHIGNEPIEFASVDVSFISLDKVLPAAKPLLAPGARMVCLIKPQFEAGRDEVGKKGVVRDKKVHEAVIRKVLLLTEELHFSVLGLTYSPIKGPEGNIEYLIYFENSGDSAESGALETAARAGGAPCEADGQPKQDSGAAQKAAEPCADEQTVEAENAERKKTEKEMMRARFGAEQYIKALVDAAHGELD